MSSWSGSEALAGLDLLAILIAISIIDAKTLRIPNVLNLLLLLCGLVFWGVESGQFPFIPLIICSMVYGAFWLLRWVHLRASGRVGLGLGDVKMLGASAAWISPFNFPLFLLTASGSALTYLSLLWVAGKDIRHLKIPFGLFIAIGLWATWGLQKSGILWGVDF